MRLRDKLLLLRAKELSVILPTLQIPRTEFGKALLMNLAVFIGRGWGGNFRPRPIRQFKS